MGTARRIKRTLTFDVVAPLGQKFDQATFNARLGEPVKVCLDFYEYRCRLVEAKITDEGTRVEVTVELTTPVNFSITL